MKKIFIFCMLMLSLSMFSQTVELTYAEKYDSDQNLIDKGSTYATFTINAPNRIVRFHEGDVNYTFYILSVTPHTASNGVGSNMLEVEETTTKQRGKIQFYYDSEYGVKFMFNDEFSIYYPPS